MDRNIDSTARSVNNTVTSQSERLTAALAAQVERRSRALSAQRLGNTPIPVYPLVTNTESASPSGSSNPTIMPSTDELELHRKQCFERYKTTENQFLDNPPTVPYPGMGIKKTNIVRMARRERYDLLHKIRPLVYREGLKEGLQFPMDWHRVGTCRAVNVDENIKYWKDKKYGKVFVTGMRICGSVWACPVCSEKIMARRREQVEKIVTKSIESKHKLYFVTFTVSHKSHDGLGDILEAFKVGLKGIRSGKPWKKFQERTGYVGLVRALEILHGANGWHPHTHEIWVTKNGMDIEAEKRKLIDRWFTRMEKLGFSGSTIAAKEAFKSISITIEEVKSDNDTLANYLTKMGSTSAWGAAHELTSAAKKQSKGLSPFQLAQDWYEGRNDKLKSKQSQFKGALFLEYLEETRKRSLKSIFISNALRSQFGMDEIVDEIDLSVPEDERTNQVTEEQEESRMSNEQRESADLVCRVDPVTHKILLEKNLECELMERLEDAGAACGHRFLSRLGYGSLLNYH